MPQVFNRGANGLARMSLVILGLVVTSLALTLNELQRSPYVTREGERLEQPVPFSHQHHVAGLGLDCRYCHTSVENSNFAGIPPTKTCMNCHSEIWTNADILEPVRASYRNGTPIWWTKLHDLPDYVYFSHEIHINKGIGCASCHGPIDEMPLTYQHASLQMEWCLDCHRNPAKNIRPVGDPIFNMGWKGPSTASPVYCEDGTGNCSLNGPYYQLTGQPMQHWKKFEDQISMGKYLVAQYHVRTPNEIQSCDTCHR
jgi:cytochrome c7-like protein